MNIDIVTVLVWAATGCGILIILLMALLTFILLFADKKINENK